MVVNEDLKKKIHEANIKVHRSEAAYYELLHPEVYSKREQKRLNRVLTMLDKLVNNNNKKALDFGSGTGNLTGKLLRMGYSVTAIDISAEMCAILKKKFNSYLKAEKLVVLNSLIEDVCFDVSEFDLITCYSVLHHLPDYVDVLRKLSVFLKKGGAMYMDHEPSPFYWKIESQSFAQLVKSAYLHSSPLINTLYFQLVGVDIPSINYALSDYWHKKDHPLDHEKIKRVFETELFTFIKRVDYHLSATWVFNPLFYLYKRVCKPEMSFWVAKK